MWVPVHISTRGSASVTGYFRCNGIDLPHEQAPSCAQANPAARCAFTLQDPVIRQAMDVDLKEAVLIFDEAHNIEDVCRWAELPCTVSRPLWRCTACLLAIRL